MTKHEFNKSYEKLKGHIRKYVRKKNLSKEDINDSELFFRLLNNSSKHLNKENVHTLLEWYIKFDEIEYSSRNEDSKFYITGIFESLLTKRIEVAAANDKFVLKLLSGIQGKEKSKAISKYILRYNRLNSAQKLTIFGLIEGKYNEYKSFTLLSQLEALYRRTSESLFVPPESKKVDIIDLIKHDFEPNTTTLLDNFKAQAIKLDTSFKNNKQKSLLGEIDSLNQLIHKQSANIKLQIFVWAWRNVTDQKGYNSIGEYRIPGKRGTVYPAIYWLCFYHAVLGLRRGRQVSIDNIIGERDEKEVLKVNERFSLSSNHLFRYLAFRKEYSTNKIKKDSAFIVDLKLTLYSQIYANKLGFEMLTALEQYYFARRVQNTLNQKTKKLSSGSSKAVTQPIHLGKEKVSIGFLNAFTQSIHLGKRYGYFEVQGIFQTIQNKNQYLFYVCDYRHPSIIMVMDDKQLTDAINSDVYKLVYIKTRGMMRIIAFYFEVLGYLPTFVSGGFLGLLKEVVIDIAADYVVENAVANMGISTAGEALTDLLLAKRGIKIGVPKVVDSAPHKVSNVPPPPKTKGKASNTPEPTAKSVERGTDKKLTKPQSITKGKVDNTPEPTAKSAERGTAKKLTEPNHRLAGPFELARKSRQEDAKAAKLKIEHELDILKTELNTNLDQRKVIGPKIDELTAKIKKIQQDINKKLKTKLDQPAIIKEINAKPNLFGYNEFERLMKTRESLILERTELTKRGNRIKKEIKVKTKDLKIALSNYYNTNPPKVKPVTKPGDPDPIVYSINDPHIAKNIDNPQEWGRKLQALADKVPHVVELDNTVVRYFYVYDNALFKRHFPHSGQGHRIASNTTSRYEKTIWDKYRKIFSRLDPELVGPKSKVGNLAARGHSNDRGKMKVAIEHLVEMELLGHHKGNFTLRHRELVRRSVLGVIEAPGNITAAEFKIFLRRKLTAPKGTPLLDHLAKEVDVGIHDYVETLKKSRPGISNQAIINHLLDKVIRIAVY